MAAREHYSLLYRLDGVERFLLWFTSESDGVVTDGDGLVPSFRTEYDLRAFAESLELRVSEEVPVLHDLDTVKAWLADRREDRIDCVAALAAWNLFGDVARSVEDGASFSEAAEEAASVYDKVFRGNNLPAVTPDGEAFRPVWSPAEARGLADVLERGFRLFAEVVRQAV